MVSEQSKASFSTKNLEQDLPRLLKSGSLEHHRDVLDRSHASSALAGGDPKPHSFLLSVDLERSHSLGCTCH